jgi:2-oxoisovalerate dehydrogenase E2 component (dihydrolipoyl transacylase)
MSTFKLPDLGEGLAEAEILEWHVKPGDHVLVDHPMVSVETAKAVVEVPAPFSGTITTLHAAAGDIVATGAPLIDFDSGTVVGTMPSTSEEELLETATPFRPGDGRSSRTRAVPLARALAKRLGLDLNGIAGSGADGLVTLDDVLVHVNRGGDDGLAATRVPGRVAAETAYPTADLSAPPGSTTEPLRGARRAMAQSMSMSRDQVSGSTVCDDADIHAWTQHGDYTLRLMRAMIAACNAEPALNAWYDAPLNARILMEHIDLAIAVDTPSGLIVPVLRDIRNQTPEELRGAIVAHKDAAHRRSAKPEDFRDFTLMLSNFGTLAGRYGIPLVVPPAVAILGAGKVRRDAVVVGDAVVAHRRMPLSLSFDHRCVSGGEACRFLAAVITDLEKPD